MTFEEWAVKWNVSAEALQDLRSLYVPPPAETGTSEAATQSRLRVLAPQMGGALWRNNRGAEEMSPGRWVRFGLGNDSDKLDKEWKSSDLIGPTPIVIKPHHVGRTVGVFTAAEVKRPDWTKPENDRDRAQEAFLVTVCKLGGIGMFITHEQQYADYIGRLRS